MGGKDFTLKMINCLMSKAISGGEHGSLSSKTPSSFNFISDYTTFSNCSENIEDEERGTNKKGRCKGTKKVGENVKKVIT